MSPSPLAGEGQLSRGESRERGRRKAKLRGHAKQMRSKLTDAEHRMWQLLRAHRFADFKFRRQEPIEFYIVDFVCFSERLIIEIDGGQHAGNHADARRDAYLQGQGFRIIRIWNNDLFNNEEGVGEAILNALRPPLPNPSPAEGRGA